MVVMLKLKRNLHAIYLIIDLNLQNKKLILGSRGIKWPIQLASTRTAWYIGYYL